MTQSEIEECDRQGTTNATVPHNEQLESWAQIVAASRCVCVCVCVCVSEQSD